MWPTPNSGITLSAAPFAYKPGHCFRFNLIEQPQGLPHIIRDTETSRFPPYGDLKQPQLSDQESKRIWKAVNAFAGEPVGGTFEEKTDQGYVIEFVGAAGKWQTVLVDPVTLTFKRLDGGSN